MNSLIRKQDFYFKKPIHRKIAFYLLFITALFMISSVIYGFVPFQEQNKKKQDSGKSRLDLLEKLENGKKITSEDIRDTYREKRTEGPSTDYPWLIESPFFFVPPPVPDLYYFPGPFYYRDHHGNDHVIISEGDLKEIHKILNESVEELRSNIESLKHSEDFMILHDELQKWNNNFRKELDKMKEDIVRSEKQTQKNRSEMNL